MHFSVSTGRSEGKTRWKAKARLNMWGTNFLRFAHKSVTNGTALSLHAGWQKTFTLTCRRIKLSWLFIVNLIQALLSVVIASPLRLHRSRVLPADPHLWLGGRQEHSKRLGSGTCNCPAPEEEEPLTNSGTHSRSPAESKKGFPNTEGDTGRASSE